MHVAKTIKHTGPTKLTSPTTVNITKSEIDPRNLLISTARITSLEDFDTFRSFLDDQRAKVAQFYAPADWTADELLAALQKAYPGGAVFHSKYQTLLEALNSDTRFYIMDTTYNLYFSYGYCCRKQRALDCPAERCHTLVSLIRDANLISTKL